jgi:hypothetical protein
MLDKHFDMTMSSDSTDLSASEGKTRETGLWMMSNSQSSLLLTQSFKEQELEQKDIPHPQRKRDQSHHSISASLNMETGALTAAASIVLMLLLIPGSDARDLVIRERTSGDQEVLAFLIGFILFLSILVIASLVSRCVWRDHRISSRRLRLNPHGSLGQDSGSGNPNSDSLYPRSRSFLSSLIHDNSDSDEDDDDEEGEVDVNEGTMRQGTRSWGSAAGNAAAADQRQHQSLLSHATSSSNTHEMSRQHQAANSSTSRAYSSFSLSSAAFHLFAPSAPSSSSPPASLSLSSSPSIPLLLSSSASSAKSGRSPVTLRKSEEYDSSACDVSPVGERTHLIQYKRLCVRIKNPDTSCGSRHDPNSNSSNSISYL